MAEARLGVRPMAGLQRSGFEVDTNVKVFQANVSKSGLVVYIPHPKFLFRSVRRTLFKAINKMRVAFMPVPLWAVFATVGAFAVQVERSSSASWLRSGSIADVLWNIDSHSPIARRLPTWVRVGYLAGWASFGVVYLLSATQRFALRRLLSYHDWLVRAHQKTLKTRVWGLIMKHVFLRRISHHLNAYQWCLPRLPLPAAKDTIARYLETVKPLLSQEEYDEHAKEAAEFLRTEAFSIQWRLWLKQKWDRNYISQWWLDLVYLRSRDSLPINSNWYGMSFAEFKPTTKQTVRAAVATYHLVRIKIALEQERLEPQILAGVAPLCMAQYDNAFSCTRIPGAEQDRLERYDKYESRHVVVMHKGRIFKLPVYSPNSMNQLSPLQLLRAFEGIVNDNRPPENGEELLPALTTLNRSEWHQIRNEYFVEDEYNRSRLEAIESSLFVVVLSEAEPADGDWTAEGRAYMCGSCHELWCDKSFNLVITKNAKAGVHAEHSWGDAPALAHITEMMMLCEKVREFYTPEGEVKTLPVDESKIAAGKFAVYRAERVDFQVRAPLRELAQDATNKFLAAAADFDLSVGCFTKFGKTHIGKKLQVSPDAFIQMSLQLAYFRDQDHFDLTYESATTRLFRDGRTETIRSLSQESVAFVKTFLAYEKGNASKADALKALRAACERHQAYTINAMRGHGVDRHLFAMFVVSYGIQKPSPFLKKAISRAWRLSTSQVPPNQCGDAAHAAVGGEMYCPNGGFGPVADDGYGVCYNVWPNRLYFNVSAKNKAPNTSAKRFLDRVLTALVDVGSLGNE